jgi:RNA polymerase sigma factor for flagellar operon FliA
VTRTRSSEGRTIEGLTRDEACRKYRPRVLIIARRMAERLPAHSMLNADDLASAGGFGLLEAFDRFEASRGVDFPVYAEYRIRGAMYDALRGVDGVSRRLRGEARQLLRTADTLRQELSREATPTEIALRLGISLDRYWALSEATQSGQVSLDQSPQDEGSSLHNQIPEPALLADERMGAAEVRSALRVAIQELPERHRQAILLYYSEGLNLAEIAKVYEVTPSRVSQLLTEARARLRRALTSQVDPADLGVQVPG